MERDVSVPFHVYGLSDDRNPNDVIVQIDAPLVRKASERCEVW